MFRVTLFCSVLGFVCTNVVIAQQDDVKPNIVLILADDLGYEAVGCYGGTSYKTPNIDQLSAQGVRFNRAYAMPLCTNTRIQMMTGKFNTRNWKSFGILDPKEKTFGHLMQEAGYKTCIAGKWQLTSYDPPDYPGAEQRRNKGMLAGNAGFNEYSLWHVGHTEDKGPRYADPVIEQNGSPLKGTKGGYGPDFWTDFIGDFMERRRDQPFFVYYSMALPHNPMVPTPDSPEWKDPSLRHQEETRFAADMIEYTDKMVGKVVAKVDELRLDRPTLVIFYSDNGTNNRVSSMLGDRVVRGGKGEGSELGIRVPAFALWRGAANMGVATDELIDSVDVLPTILDVAGASQLIPKQIDGISFAALLATKKTAAADANNALRDWVYIHQDPRPGWDKDRFGLIRVALDKRFKLFEDGRLFDLQNDPFEEQPLFVNADDVVQSASRRKLQRVLDSMKPYPMFDSESTPRPNPNDRFAGYQFQSQNGCIVIEAEDLPIPRDESWRPERNAAGYTGNGYLRALRDQDQPPTKGVTLVSTSVRNAGRWSMAIRCRSDHASRAAENQFWFKAGDGSWQVGRISESVAAGEWTWVQLLTSADLGAAKLATFELGERTNNFSIAPRSGNLKIDRIVLYQADQRERALDTRTPVSDYHPWAKP